METNSFYPIMLNIAERGLRNQVKGPNDFVAEDGMLHCGECKEPRQMWMDFPNPTEEDPENKDKIKVTRPCRCEREKEEAEKREAKALEDMKAVERIRKASLMDEKFRDADFSHFEQTKFNAKNLKLCRRYVDAFDKMVQNNQGLLFYGGVGIGKSFAAATIANELMKKKVPVIMTSFVKLLEMIQEGTEQESAILSKLNRAQLVIFDDLGAERNTDYALEKVYNIVDTRYRRQLPMILTTNLTVEEMKEETDIRYGRIYDRIFECCYPMQFTGTSWRKKTASRRYSGMEKLLNDD